MEIEYFVKPDTAGEAFETWVDSMKGWVDALGLSDEHVRIREHEQAELSHYSDRTIDFEYLFPGPMGWKELYGLANRTDFDLRQHQEFSGEDLTWFDQEVRNALSALCHRADLRGRPHHPGGLAGRLRRGSDGRCQRQGRHPHRAASRSEGRAVQGRHLAA